ncbi:carbohydrate ABC transporter permease [Paenibacillus sp. SC116]|uniref:carbohydrate ABC transporter permease n=1 Tax=Paenibacillus sp. SC116 TaxID=2968986 RepID=UPI00215A1DCA|nr:carbohydrate ABC transporter permease [Paenibacillus sp. SC116]MCR8843259.1 carbohydrate ABC transporter permease [Paenibacillus sp. SC116]
MKLTFGDKMLQIWIYSFLTLLAFVTVYPFWNAGVISLNDGKDTMLGGITFWPREFTLENYKIVLQDERILNGFVISISRTVLGTLLSIFATSLLAYGMTKRELMGRKYYMIMCVFTMYFSGGLIPSYLLIRELGLMDTFWVMILPGLVSVWNMIIFRTFFAGLPAGLEESAKMDGCGPWKTYFYIVLPLSGPVIATLSLFTAVAHWNEWFIPSIYINNENLLPVQTILRNTLNANIMTEQMSKLDPQAAARMAGAANVTTKSLSMATMMVATLPIIMVYPFLQRFFVKGVLVGSLKE